ncbi:AAA family ATPase [Psychromarinibacter sp. S121]|uniref:AAA family ATPase n=1 Tax=Psychromarinibacter sp. S121 TaxID=3415127 RepID=UPI003C79CDEA
MDSKIIDIQDLPDVVRSKGANGRTITAIAGPPGAGKSTVSDRLAELLNEAEPDSAAVFPMDGFHYDDMILNARGWRPRKGAPHTFDVRGFGHMLDRLRANDEPEVAVPVFDRAIETSRNAARIIPQSVRHIVVEGNYLLLQDDPWNTLADRFDTTVFLDVPYDTLKARLAQRWKALAPDDFEVKMEGNDLPNVRLVQTHSVPADYRIVNA